MNILALGASGKTGSQIVKKAHEAGYTVNALVRRPESLETQPDVNVFIGDVTDQKDIINASKDSDVIISARGAMGGSLMTDAVNAVISASKETGVKRFTLMSSWAVRKEQLNGFTKLISGLLMGSTVKDKYRSEELLRKSELDWTIMYATLLTDEPSGAKVRTVNKNESISMNNKISRADVAAWILAEAKNNDFVKKK